VLFYGGLIFNTTFLPQGCVRLRVFEKGVGARCIHEPVLSHFAAPQESLPLAPSEDLFSRSCGDTAAGGWIRGELPGLLGVSFAGFRRDDSSIRLYTDGEFFTAYRTGDAD